VVGRLVVWLLPLVLTGDLGTHAEVAASEVARLYGSEGTLPPMGVTPSGHSLATDAVPGWRFAPGKAAYLSALTHDGTVIMGAEEQRETSGWHQTADGMQIVAFQPGGRRFQPISLRTDAGHLTATTPAGRPAGADIGDVEPVKGTDAVAFTGVYPFQDHSAGDHWPVFGLITRGSRGTWRVASQWSSPQLRALIADPALREQACPATGVADCGSLNEIASLPASRDLVISQYFGANAAKGGRILVLRVGGPPRGPFTVEVRASYAYPAVTAPGDPFRQLTPAIREVQPDPTGVPGDERFAVAFDVFPPGDGDPVPSGLQEFRYDAAATDPFQAITPVSAPVLSGDVSISRDPVSGLARYTRFVNLHYDLQGNLWAGQADLPYAKGVLDLNGGRLAVYAAGAGRRLSGTCGYVAGRTLSSYVSPAAPGVRAAWGLTCPPDYSLTQPRDLGAAWGLVEDPSTRTIAQIFISGTVLPVRAYGSGAGMSFAVGNPFAPGLAAIRPPAAGLQPGVRQAGVDSSHRLWFTVQSLASPGNDEARRTLPQWLYRVDLTRLMSADRATLPGVIGGSELIQAERTATTSTYPGQGRGERVSTAYAFPSFDRADPTHSAFTVQGPGFGVGVPDGTILEFPVSVPSAGTYRITYRATGHPGSTIGLSADGRGTVATTAIPCCRFAETASAPFSLGPGAHTIRLTAPPGGGGWSLNWVKITRL
jgi:hypothetical protein